MSEYNTDGYTDVRTYVYNNHNWIGIFDDTDTELLRWDLSANTNVTEVSGPASNPIEYDIEITGQDIIDAGYSLPVTIVYGQVYDSDTSSTPFASDNFADDSGADTSATIKTSGDTVVVAFTNEWPNI